jgi:hypothetical protein
MPAFPVAPPIAAPGGVQIQVLPAPAVDLPLPLPPKKEPAAASGPQTLPAPAADRRV